VTASLEERIRGEFLEMPGLRLTPRQASRLWAVDASTSEFVLDSLTSYIKSSDAQLARWGLDTARFKVAEQDHYARQMQLFGTVQAPIYNVYVRGTDHVTFSDLYRIIAVPSLERIDVRRAHRIIVEYTIAFLDRFLDGRRTPLVDDATPSPYWEVTVARRNVEKPL
jgi:hypothetical protein